jgi:hypothetical protein
MAHKVFICHSSKDKAVADAACAALEAHRIPCWIAPRDILAGDEYAASIIDALDECQIVLLIFSKDADNSPQCRREIERAVSKEKILLPFRIENVLPSRAMEFALMNTHWLDALSPPVEHRLADLVQTVSRLLQRQRTAAPIWGASEPQAVTPPPLRKSPAASPSAPPLTVEPPTVRSNVTPLINTFHSFPTEPQGKSKTPFFIGLGIVAAVAILVLVVVVVSSIGNTNTFSGGATPVATAQQAQTGQPVASLPTASDTPSVALPTTGDEPYFMVRPISESDIEGKSVDDLNEMRNEIYARHGRRFANPAIQAYFDAQPWYKPIYAPNAFPASLLTPVQSRNVGWLLKMTK